MSFTYVLRVPDEELELARAELWALAGVETDGRIAHAPFACDISRSAYVMLCAEALVEASSLEDLCTEVRALAPSSERFLTTVQYLDPKPIETTPEIPTRLGDALHGHPDLNHPLNWFHVLCREGSWEFMRVLSSCHRGYLRHRDRPHHFSHALPTRQARAFVNLVAAPGDRILDPCCGMGTCLVEAWDMGIRASGIDINWHSATGARENLAHFGMPGTVTKGDAREACGSYDAIVMDLPYGLSSHIADGLYEEVLANVATLAPRLGVVVAAPDEALFEHLGLRIARCAKVRKANLTRHYYVLAT